MGNAQEIPPSKGVPERQRGWGMLVGLLDTLWVNRMNIPLRRSAFATRRCPPSKGELLAHEEWGMLVRLLGKLLLNPINISLRRFAFATRCCPLRRGNFWCQGYHPLTSSLLASPCPGMAKQRNE